MASKYFTALVLFASYNVQSMEIIDFKQKKEDAYVSCIAPMMASANKYSGSSQDWEAVCRRNWKDNKAERRNFKRIVCAIASNDNDAVTSKEDYDVVARLWKKDAAFRMECQKCFVKQALAVDKTFADLPVHVLNIVGGFVKRSGKDTLRCVNKALNAQVLSQDELYALYQEAKDSCDNEKMNQALRYSAFIPEPKYELLDALKDNNMHLVECHLKKCSTYDLYRCIEATLEQDFFPDKTANILHNVDIVNRAQVISAEKSCSGKPLMLIAVEQGNIAMMRALALHGVDLNRAHDVRFDEGLTALIYAAKKGKVELVKELVTYPYLEIDKGDRYGLTALSRAMQEITRPDERGYSRPYNLKYYEIIRTLLAAGADPELVDLYRETPFKRINNIVAQHIKKRSYVCKIEIDCNAYIKDALSSDYYMRDALARAGADSELADIVCLVRQVAEKKHALDKPYGRCSFGTIGFSLLLGVVVHCIAGNYK